MPDNNPHIFAGANEINITQSTFNVAGGDIIHNPTYIYLSTDEILTTLKPVNRVRHTNRCMPGTRHDILKEISHWLGDVTDDSKNILLICGSPGAGKSAVAASVVFDLDERQRLASSFAFKHTNADLCDPSVVWRTVASDLARFHPGVKDSLIMVLKSVDPGRDLALQFQRLIVEPLMKNQGELLSKPPVVVLDALDECGSDRSQSDERRRLLETLTQWSSLPRAFKLIVTSRDERLPISFRQSCRTIVLQTGHRVPSETTNDISHFFEERFALIAEEYPSLHDWPGKRTIDLLATRAAGLFIWAETLIRFVCNEKDTADKQLELVLHGDLGEERDVINGLYQRILDVSFGQSGGRILDALRTVIGTVVLAKVPLRRNDLVHFLTSPVQESVIDFILNKLSSVISISPTDQLVHICHLSFVDFICNHTRSPHVIDRSACSASLASSCFKLMSAGLKFNICGLETSHCRNDNVQDMPARIATSVPPRLSYACRFGWQHLRDVLPDASFRVGLLKDIDDFLHVRLLYWLEVMSLIKEIPAASSALHFMTRWIGISHPDLAAFASDAARFVVNFATPISTSTPHIYLSALPWSPYTSKIAQHYLPRFPHRLSIRIGAESDWPASVNLFVGHTDHVTSVAFSPDGKRVVSGSDDKTIRIWNSETGEMVAGPFEGHTNCVTSVAFSPDGKRIVSSSDDWTIRIWDSETGDIVAGPFEGHTDWVTSVAFSPDGKRVVSGSDNRIICIWDSETGEVMAGPFPFEGHTDCVTSVAFSPDGKRVVSGSYDLTICIWDSETGDAVAGPFKGHRDSITSVALSPDGKRVASGSFDKTILIWDSETGEMVAGPFEGHTICVNSVAFSPDGKRVVSGSNDKTIRIWDSETGGMVAGPFEGHTDCVTSVAFSPDGERVVSGSEDETIRIWDSETGEVVPDPSDCHTARITSVAFSPNGERVVSGSIDKTIRIWDSETGEMVAGPLKGHTGWVSSVAFSPDGKRVVSGSDDRTIRIWDSETGDVVAVFEDYRDWVTSVAFSPDGKRIVSGSDDMMIRIRDSETGEVIAGPFEGHTFYVKSVAFSPDGKRVVSGSYDMTIRIWDAETGKMVAGPFKSHTDRVTSVDFSPDGKHVASGSDDKTVRICDSETGELVAGPFEGHTDWVISVAFSPDGKRVVSGSDDKTVRIWDSGTGEMVAGPFEGHTDRVTSVAFSPNGRRVVSGSDDRTLRIWDSETGGAVLAPFEGQVDCVTSVGFSPNRKHVVLDPCDRGRYNHCHFDFSTGWIKTDDGSGLLFWIPVKHRGRVCGTDTTVIMGQRMTGVDLNTFAHGPHWAQCHHRLGGYSDTKFTPSF